MSDFFDLLAEVLQTMQVYGRGLIAHWLSKVLRCSLTVRVALRVFADF